MRSSYSPSPSSSSRRQSRSPSPRAQKYSSNVNFSSKKNRSFSKTKPNDSNIFHKIITLLIFVFILIYICIVPFLLSSPTRFCHDQLTSYCKSCPNGAKCTDDDFTCKDESQVKFIELCHSPGNFFKDQNLSLLYQYQSLLYNFVEDNKGQATVDDAIKANLHLDNEPPVNLSIDDVEIIWTYDGHYYISDNGVLRFHPTPIFKTLIFTILFLILFGLLYFIDKNFFA